MRNQASIAALLSLAATAAFAAPAVVTDIVPTGAMVQAVMGELGEVRVLLPQGASAHHYQMRPSDAQALQDADLVVWMGPELAPWLDRATGNLAADAQLRLLGVEGIKLRSFGSAGEEHDHDHGGHDHDHSHAGTDPHAWLNPDNVGPWLDAIVASLSAQDPENAQTYRANADAFAMRIETLDSTLSQRLAPHSDARFVVFHDAYGYFTEHFGLQPAVPVSLGDASTPSAARIDEIRGQIAQSGATCAFPEYAHDPALIDTVIEGTDVRVGGELSPAGGDLAPGANQYEALLTAMTNTMIACFDAG
ncbi:zinc ABC transporter substrate-binding protein [Paracoccus rhizosphaerae]|uniref:High-affinity zinc uptake system protein ZnuA n=1 Tax=Paracoccus rhizosphaerae TaxID=1133347 RepID=A0ABV6CIV6_9RHOB|nr:zinc ABC transporter substrate-binding protein [Paracoccus rhizosphaerae]